MQKTGERSTLARFFSHPLLFAGERWVSAHRGAWSFAQEGVGSRFSVDANFQQYGAEKRLPTTPCAAVVLIANAVYGDYDGSTLLIHDGCAGWPAPGTSRSHSNPCVPMDSSPTDSQVMRLVAVIRKANVRDEAYIHAEKSIIGFGSAVRSVLLTLLSDPDRVVRERATELLRKLPPAV